MSAAPEKSKELAESPHKGSNSANGSREDLSDQEGYGSSEEHIFKDPTVANHWRNVYETARYENRHRFDPDFTWTAEEEKKLVRKIDLRIMLWAWIMFCALDLHRRNINRASRSHSYTPSSPDIDGVFRATTG